MIQSHFFFHNVGSLSKYIGDITSDDRIISNNIIGFTETQITPPDTTCKIIETLNLFNINFNSNENRLSLA